MTPGHKGTRASARAGLGWAELGDLYCYKGWGGQLGIRAQGQIYLGLVQGLGWAAGH